MQSAGKRPANGRADNFQTRPKYFAAQRDQVEEKISTEECILPRVNHSIQAEGVFAYTKEYLGFRRFLLRGIEVVSTEWFLLAIAHIVNVKNNHKSSPNLCVKCIR